MKRAVTIFAAAAALAAFVAPAFSQEEHHASGYIESEERGEKKGDSGLLEWEQT